MPNADLVAARLDRAARAARLLDHPFYEAWRAGTLTRDDLAFYSTQYWRQVEAFPGYLQALADRLPTNAAQVVRANLRDEVEGDHAGMWLAFAEAVGAAERDVRDSSALPETSACVESFATAAASASLPFALGMIYGYESQTPEVATTKAQGLRELYGVEGPGVAYFDEHGAIDVEHSAELARALSDVVGSDADLEEAAAGAEAGAKALWRLLDGVERERQLTSA